MALASLVERIVRRFVQSEIQIDQVNQLFSMSAALRYLLSETIDWGVRK